VREVIRYQVAPDIDRETFGRLHRIAHYTALFDRDAQGCIIWDEDQDFRIWKRRPTGISSGSSEARNCTGSCRSRWKKVNRWSAPAVDVTAAAWRHCDAGEGVADVRHPDSNSALGVVRSDLIGRRTLSMIDASAWRTDAAGFGLRAAVDVTEVCRSEL
jgi:hypothetical protein